MPLPKGAKLISGPPLDDTPPDLNIRLPKGAVLLPEDNNYYGVDAPAFKPEPGFGENILNRTLLGIDSVHKGIYQKLQADAEAGVGMGSIIQDIAGPDFLKNRVKAQDEDILAESQHIKQINADNTPWTFSNFLSKTDDYLQGELPILVGSSLSLMGTGLASAALGAVAGGPIGAFAGAAVGFGIGRYTESLAEAGQTYQDAIDTLKKNNPKMSEVEIHQKALEASDDVFTKNMAIGLKDIPELILSFAPLGSVASKLGRGVGFALRETEAMYPRMFGLGRMAAVMGLEGSEEGLQYVFQESALNKLRPEDQKVDLSIHGLSSNKEFLKNIMGGMVLGGLEGGIGAVTTALTPQLDRLNKEDVNVALNEQNLVREQFFYNTMKSGKEAQLTAMIKTEAQKPDGIFSDQSITDKDKRVGDAEAKASQYLDMLNGTKTDIGRRDIFYAIEDNKNIKDDNNKRMAYFNQIEINSLENEIKTLEKTPEINAEKISQAKERLALLKNQNIAIGKGDDIWGQIMQEQEKLKQTQAEPVVDPVNPVDASTDLPLEQTEITPQPILNPEAVADGTTELLTPEEPPNGNQEADQKGQQDEQVVSPTQPETEETKPSSVSNEALPKVVHLEKLSEKLEKMPNGEVSGTLHINKTDAIYNVEKGEAPGAYIKLPAFGKFNIASASKNAKINHALHDGARVIVRLVKQASWNKEGKIKDSDINSKTYGIPYGDKYEVYLRNVDGSIGKHIAHISVAQYKSKEEIRTQANKIPATEEVKPPSTAATPTELQDKIETLISEHQKIPITKHDTHYEIGKDKVVYQRVSGKIGTIYKTANKKSKSAGNVIDEIGRNFFQHDKAIKPEGITDEAFGKLIKQLTAIKNSLEEKNWRFITKPIVVYNSAHKVAGELDIIAVSPNGEVRIVDFKSAWHGFNSQYTKERENGSIKRSYKEEHSLQLSAYKNLFEHTFGIPVKGLSIIPFKVDISKGEIQDIERRPTIQLAYNSKVEEMGIPAANMNQPVTAQQRVAAKEKITKELATQVVQKLSNRFGINAVLINDPKLSVAGYNKGGKAYINLAKAGLDTPFHEFAHPFVDAIENENKKVYNNLVGEIQNSEAGKQILDKVKEEYPDYNASQQVKEAIVQAIGEHAAGHLENTQSKGLVGALKDLFKAITGYLKQLLYTNRVINPWELQDLSLKDLGILMAEGDSVIDISDLKAGIYEQEEENINSASKDKGFKYYADRRGWAELEKEEGALREKQAEASKEEGEGIAARLLEIEKEKNGIKERYEKWVKDQADIRKLIAENEDISNKSVEDLSSLYLTIQRYDDTSKTEVLKSILGKIASVMEEKRWDELTKINPALDKKVADASDISGPAVYIKPLSDFSENHPVEQALNNSFKESNSKFSGDYHDLLNKKNKLLKAVISEQDKTVGERAKAFFNITEGNAKYSSFIYEKDGSLLSDEKIEKLSPAKKAYAEFVKETIKELSSYQQTKDEEFGRAFAPTVKKTFFESLVQDGFFDAWSGLWSNDERLSDVQVLFKDPVTKQQSVIKLSEAEEKLQKYFKKGLVSKWVSLTDIASLKKQAKKKYRADNMRPLKDVEFRDGKIQSKFNNGSVKNFSKDFDRAFNEFAHDMLFIKHMQGVIPQAEAALQYAKEMGKVNTAKFLDLWIKNNLTKEQLTGFMGKEVDFISRVLRLLTHMKVMSFNIPSATFNALAGKYNHWREEGGKNLIRAEYRYFKQHQKWSNVIDKYYPSAREHELDPRMHAGKFFSHLAYGLTRAGENWIRGSQFVGSFTEQEASWLNDKGEVIGKSPEEIAERTEKIEASIKIYVDKVESVQGKGYSESDKPNFTAFELGRLAFQFKIWVPSFLRRRIASEYIDANGVRQKGSFRELGMAGLKRLREDASVKEFFTSDDPFYVNQRKNFRDAIFVFGLAAAVGDSGDDDKANKAMYRAISDALYFYDPKSNKFIVQQMAENPLPALHMIGQFSKAASQLLARDEYKNSTDEHEAGDLKGATTLRKELPYNKTIDLFDDIAGK